MPTGQYSRVIRKPIHVIGPSIAYIPLTKGHHALIDSLDIPRVEYYNWCACLMQGQVYVVTSNLFKGEKKTNTSIHRLLSDYPNDFFVDHVNHNGLDNRQCNLRVCSRSQNQHNRGPMPNTTSRFKGVRRDKKHSAWWSSIRAYGKTIYLGRHPTEELAARAYDAKAKELHGEFAYQNFPLEPKRNTEEA